MIDDYLEEFKEFLERIDVPFDRYVTDSELREYFIRAGIEPTPARMLRARETLSYYYAPEPEYQPTLEEFEEEEPEEEELEEEPEEEPEEEEPERPSILGRIVGFFRRLLGL